jgi:hypothetical protein
MLRINQFGQFEDSGKEVEAASYRGDTQVKSEAQLNQDQIAKTYAEANAKAEKMIAEAKFKQEERLVKKNLEDYRDRVFNEQQIRRQIMREARSENPLAYAKALEQATWLPNDIQTMSDTNYHGTKYFAGPKLVAKKAASASDLRSSALPAKAASARMAGGHFPPSYDFERIKLDVEFGNGQQGEIVQLPNLSTPVAEQVEYISSENVSEAIAGYMGGWFDDLVDSAKEGITSGAQDRIEDEAYKLLNPDEPVPMPATTQVVTRTVPGTTTMMSKAMDPKVLMIGAAVFGVALLGIIALKSRPAQGR